MGALNSLNLYTARENNENTHTHTHTHTHTQTDRHGKARGCGRTRIRFCVRSVTKMLRLRSSRTGRSTSRGSSRSFTFCGSTVPEHERRREERRHIDRRTDDRVRERERDRERERKREERDGQKGRWIDRSVG